MTRPFHPAPNLGDRCRVAGRPRVVPKAVALAVALLKKPLFNFTMGPAAGTAAAALAGVSVLYLGSALVDAGSRLKPPALDPGPSITHISWTLECFQGHPWSSFVARCHPLLMRQLSALMAASRLMTLV